MTHARPCNQGASTAHALPVDQLLDGHQGTQKIGPSSTYASICINNAYLRRATGRRSTERICMYYMVRRVPPHSRCMVNNNIHSHIFNSACRHPHHTRTHTAPPQHAHLPPGQPSAQQGPYIFNKGAAAADKRSGGDRAIARHMTCSRVQM